MTRPLAIAMAEGVGAAIVPIDDPRSPTDFSPIWIDWPEVAGTIGRIERDDSPRWVWWPESTPRALVAVDVRPARSWDLGAVHRLLVGGWRNSPAAIWANCHGLDGASAPEPAGAPDLFSAAAEAVDEDDPIHVSGHLSPEWLAGGWHVTPGRITRHAQLAAECFLRQQELVRAVGDAATVTATRLFRVGRRIAVRRARTRWAADRSRRRRGPDRRLHRSAAGRRGARSRPRRRA